jgi:hypothetical protein
MMTNRPLATAEAVALLFALSVRIDAQGPPQSPPPVQQANPYGEPQPEGQRQGPPQPAQPPRVAAPIDITGYWVSLVTDDWRWRMVTPPKGDVLYLPVNAEGRKVAEAWDPAGDEAAGEACRAYGAAGVMRLPGRLHISWENDYTLKVETDAGTQTRIFNFAGGRPGGAPLTRPQNVEPSWQGYSVAQWEFDGRPARRGVMGGGGATPARRNGSLKVVTTRMKPGYFRKNGVPYSANAVLTEYFARITEPSGDEYLVVTNFLEDPKYLNGPYVRSVQFKRQKDATGWNPTPCSAR